jgi:dihydrofolate reductase
MADSRYERAIASTNHRMSRPTRIEGFAIVSADGMLANAAGNMPPELIVEADQRFFEQALDAAAVAVHGRLSQEDHPRSSRRRRLIITRSVSALAPHPTNPMALWWNPAGASLETAWAAIGGSGTLAVIGGTDIFGLFLPLYDAFHLSLVPTVALPGGRPVFPGVPDRTPDEILMAAGLRAEAPRVLDAASGVTLATWTRLGK